MVMMPNQRPRGGTYMGSMEKRRSGTYMERMEKCIWHLKCRNKIWASMDGPRPAMGASDAEMTSVLVWIALDRLWAPRM